MAMANEFVPPPEDIDNHESLVVALQHRWMVDQTKPDGEPYATLPTGMKRLLASCTGGCSKDWRNNSEKQRVTWWHMHYDNLRYHLTGGDSGRPGGEQTQERMLLANEYWLDHESSAIQHAMECFYRDHGVEERNQIISGLGEDSAAWGGHISEHGEEHFGPDTSMMRIVADVTQRILEDSPMSLNAVRTNRRESVPAIAEREREQRSVLGERYSAAIESNIRRVLFDGEDVAIMKFDEMIFDYISGENEDIISDSEPRSGDKDGYSEFRNHLQEGRSRYSSMSSDGGTSGDGEPVEDSPADQIVAQSEDERYWPKDDVDWSEWLGELPPPKFPLTYPGTGVEHPRNRIVYGAPGTGKSYKIQQQEVSFENRNVRRVTFHPDYTYGNFVGSYRPVPVFQGDKLPFQNEGGKDEKIPGTPHILYRLVAGPFLELLKDAWNSYDQDHAVPHLLIIEEINRANPSAVLGDVFQLLDRKNGFSEYPVRMNPEIMEFLDRGLESNEVGNLFRRRGVMLPPNLYIWATMNTTDEGVFPVDSAFRRRWTMEHVSIDDEEREVEEWEMPPVLTWLNGASWNQFRKKINEKLSDSDYCREDQLLGPFFFSKEELGSLDSVKNKLLDYLHQSLLRHNPSLLFNGDYGQGSFSRLMKDFDTTNVFSDQIKKFGEAPEGGSGEAVDDSNED